MAEGSVNLKSIVVQGVDAHRAEMIRHEVQSILTPWANIDLELPLRIDLKVVITDEMASAVNRYSAELNISSSKPYRQERLTVKAAGIALSQKLDKLIDAVIIIDIDPWMEDTGIRMVQRAYLLAHEFGHVLQVGLGTNVSYDFPKPGTSPTHLQAVERFALILRNEYDADIKAYTICQCLRDENGDSIKLGTVLGVDYVQVVADLLDSVCRFVEDVELYRCFDVFTVEELDHRAQSIISELLTVLTHLIVLYASQDDSELLFEMLLKIRGFTEYLEPSWKDFIGGITSDESEDGVRLLAGVLNSVFDRIGLEYEDMPDGSRYMHVHQPIHCTDTE